MPKIITNKEDKYMGEIRLYRLRIKTYDNQEVIKYVNDYYLTRKCLVYECDSIKAEMLLKKINTIQCDSKMIFLNYDFE